MCSQVVIGLGARRAKDAQCKPAEERAKQRRCFEPFECNASLPTKTLQVGNPLNISIIFQSQLKTGMDLKVQHLRLE